MSEDFKYLECRCTTPEHTLRFARDEDHTYITFFLDNGPWYRRVVTGIRYILGYKCRYGHFDEVVLGRDEVRRLVEILGDE